jgi:antitoxin component YwqK of YwqJK toxin-antitoxin module
METVNLNQPSANENGIYLLGNTPFSGFAIETFPDGSLQTQVALMHGLQDGVTRRWHPNGQLESEQEFRNGKPHGWHRKWEPDGTLQAEFAWTAGIRGGGATGKL